MAESLDAYWTELLKPKKCPEGHLHALEDETLAALNLAASVVANADMVEDPGLEVEFALVAWEDEVAQNVHPPLRKLRECREWNEGPFRRACRPCVALKLDGELACRTLM